MLILGTRVACRVKGCRYNEYGVCKRREIVINESGLCQSNSMRFSDNKRETETIGIDKCKVW